MRYEGINRTSNENRSTTDSELFGDPTPNEDRRQNTPNYDFNLRKENLGQGKREHAFAEVYTPAGEQWAWKADDSTLVGEQWGWKSGKGLVSDCTEVTGVTRPWSEPVKGLPSGRGEGRKAGRELRAASGSRAGKGIRAGPTLGGRDRARGEGRQRSASSGCEPADRQVEDLNRVDLILSKLGTSTRSFSRPLDNHRPKGDAAAMPKAGPHAPVSEREFSQVIEDIEGSGVLEITDKSQEITDKSQEITDYVAATTASKCVNNGVNGEEDVSKTSIESFAEKAMAMDLRDTTKNQINDGERFGSNGGEVVGSDVGSEGKVVSAGAEFGPAEERKGSSKGVCLLSQSKHSDLEHISSDEESEDEKYNSKVQVDHYGFFINSERCGPDIPKVAMKKRVLKETSRTEKWLLMVDGPIEEDVPRTMYDHEMFCKKTGVHGRNMLRRVLTAYGRYDREVQYCQGMNYICALFLLYMPEENAFWLLVAVMHRTQAPLRDLFLPGMIKVQEFQYAIDSLTGKFCKKFHVHITSNGLTPSMYATQWFLTAFTQRFPYDLVTRVWDIFLLEDWKIFYRVCLALFKSVEEEVVQLNLEEMNVTLRNLPPSVDTAKILEVAFKLPLKHRHITKRLTQSQMGGGDGNRKVRPVTSSSVF